MIYQNTLLTKKGIELNTKLKAAGTALRLNYLATGAGKMPLSESSTMLTDQRQKFTFDKISVDSDNKNVLVLQTTLNNKYLQSGYDIGELGIYAEDPDDGSILYAVINTDDSSDYDHFDTYAENAYEELLMRIKMRAENADKIEFVFAPEGLERKLEDFKQENDDKLKEMTVAINKKAEKTDLTSPFNFRGALRSSDLPQSNNKVNDTYYCTDLAYRMSWNGTGWQQSSMSEKNYADALRRVDDEAKKANNRFSNLIKNGTVRSDKTGYAIIGRWTDGNPNNENRIGHFVNVFKRAGGELDIYKAPYGSEVGGVAIAGPAYAEAANDNQYDEHGVLKKQYNYVCIAGYAVVIDNGECTSYGRCRPDENSCAAPSINDSGFKIIGRVDDSHILIQMEPQADSVMLLDRKVGYAESKIYDSNAVIGRITNDLYRMFKQENLSTEKKYYVGAELKVGDILELDGAGTVRDYQIKYVDGSYGGSGTRDISQIYITSNMSWIWAEKGTKVSIRREGVMDDITYSVTELTKYKADKESLISVYSEETLDDDKTYYVDAGDIVVDDVVEFDGGGTYRRYCVDYLDGSTSTEVFAKSGSVYVTDNVELIYVEAGMKVTIKKNTVVDDIDKLRKSVALLDKNISDTKKSVSDGKTLVATAITDKGVATEATDTFTVMAENIDKIQKSGKGTSNTTVLNSTLVSEPVKTKVSHEKVVTDGSSGSVDIPDIEIGGKE